MRVIKLSDKDYDFLKNTAALMMTQDNKATANPLYCVYQKIKVITPEGVGDHVGWLKDSESVSEKEVMDAVKQDCEAHPEKDNRTDDEVAEELGYEKYYYKLEDVPVQGQTYLTELAAQFHIDKNSYHYHKPFVYVESAWRNPEIQNLRRIICAIFGMEAPT